PAQSFEGNKLPGIAPHHLFGRVTMRIKSWQIEPQLEWNSKLYVDDANTESAMNHSYAILHLQWRVAVLHSELLGGITNLTNKRYNSSVVINAAGGRYYEPAAGRALYLGLKKILF